MNVSVNNNDKSVSCENEERVSSGISSNTGSKFFGDKLKALRLSNVDCIIVAQINVNPIRNKFDALIAGIQNKVDILLISETKLDETFPTRQFSIDGFTSPYRWIQMVLGAVYLLMLGKIYHQSLSKQNS